MLNIVQSSLLHSYPEESISHGLQNFVIENYPIHFYLQHVEVPTVSPKDPCLPCQYQSVYLTKSFFYHCPEYVICHRISWQMQALYVMVLPCSGRQKTDPIAKTLEITFKVKYESKDWRF